MTAARTWFADLQDAMKDVGRQAKLLQNLGGPALQGKIDQVKQGFNAVSQLQISAPAAINSDSPFGPSDDKALELLMTLIREVQEMRRSVDKGLQFA